MTLSWGAEPHSESYEVYRGERAEIRARHYGQCQNHRDPDTTDTVFVEDDSPEPGGFWGYLVIGADGSGTRGLAGLDSGGRERDLRARDCY